MLSSPAPFPYVGSYALIEHEGEHTLARIVFRREGEFVVSLPLKEGATGNLRVASGELIDATPLTAAETREFHDLDRDLSGRTNFRSARQKRDRARRDTLKQRMMFGPKLDRLMRFLPAAQRYARAA